MEKRTTVLIALMILGALLIAEAALAAPSAPVSISNGGSSRRDLGTLPGVTVDAQAGNVTQINITALAITKSWQGYYGNVSGTITLDTANNKTFYNWSMTSAKGQIYAARVAAPDFTTVNCTTAGAITTEETALGQTATDSDSVANTFTGTANPQFYVGSVDIPANTCKTTNAFGSTGAQSSDFYQVLLSDTNGSGNIIYTTLMNGTKAGFDGNNWDFELLVGQDGHTGGSTTTPYYFFVELA